MPVRARVAFLVVVAEAVLPVLSTKAKLHESARAALNDAWDWLKGMPVTAQSIYAKHFDHLAELSCEKNTPTLEAALNATISAMYYLLWHAFQKELANGTIKQSEVHDMSEGDEGLMDEVCQFVIQADPAHTEWVDRLANWAVRNFVSRGPYDYGNPVKREAFLPLDWHDEPDQGRLES